MCLKYIYFSIPTSSGPRTPPKHLLLNFIFFEISTVQQGYELQLLSFKDWRNGRTERKEQEGEWKREGEGKELERDSN